MRLALFSDIHGNLVALDAVLADLTARGPYDALGVAGDLCESGPDPRAVLARLRGLSRALSVPVAMVQGNNDRYLTVDDPRELRALGKGPKAIDGIAWTRAQLSADDLAFLAALPFAHTFANPLPPGPGSAGVSPVPGPGSAGVSPVPGPGSAGVSPVPGSMWGRASSAASATRSQADNSRTLQGQVQDRGRRHWWDPWSRHRQREQSRQQQTQEQEWEEGQGQDLLMVHANTRDLETHIDPDASPAEVARLLAGMPETATAVAFGHLHVPYVRRVDGRLLIDVASVGPPKDGDPRAAYAIAEFRDGAWQAAIHRVAYDVEKTVAAIRASGMPHPKKRIDDLRKASY